MKKLRKFFIKIKIYQLVKLQFCLKMQTPTNFLEKELAELLFTIAKLENDVISANFLKISLKKIEEHRINLAENDKFNSEDAFETLDRHRHGYLIISDFTHFFS